MLNQNTEMEMPETEEFRADIYGSRARIGYTSPPLTTEIFPYEFYKIVPAGVTLVVTSLAIVVRQQGRGRPVLRHQHACRARDGGCGL